MQCAPWAHVRDHLGEAPQEGSVPISPSSGWQNPSEQPGSVAEASGDEEQSAGSCCTRLWWSPLQAPERVAGLGSCARKALSEQSGEGTWARCRSCSRGLAAAVLEGSKLTLCGGGGVPRGGQETSRGWNS